MVYFGKKQSGTGPIAGSATLAGNNTFTGTNTFNNPVVVGTPVSNNDATTKQYVDDALANKADTSALANYATLAGNNTFTGTNTFNNPVSVANPVSNSDATNKEYLDNQIATCAKLASDNTFTGTNTFNNPITSTSGFYTTNTNADILKMDAQNTKKANVVFKQSAVGYKNYCFLQCLWTANDTDYTNLLTFEFRPNATGNDTNKVIITTDLAQISFNKPVVDIPNPTQATQVANKQYVDGIIKQKEVLLSSAQWKNNINSNKTRVYGFTTDFTTAQKDNVIGVELFVNTNWNTNGENSYVCTFAKYGGDELKVFVSRYDGQAVNDTTLDACTIKIRYVDNITTV